MIIFQVTSLGTGKDFADDWSSVLMELSITDQSDGQADHLRVLLSDTTGTLAIPSKGEKVSVALGEDGVPLKIGLYVIDEIGLEGPPDKIEIIGHACPFDDAGTWVAMQTRRSRSWDNITIGDLVRGIAAEHGLAAAVAPSMASITIPHVDQTAESNVSLLARLARTYDALFKPASGRLVFATTDGGSISGAPMAALTVQRGPGMKFKCKFLQATDFSGVKTEYHDVASGQTKAVLAGIEGPAAKIYRDTALHPDEATAKHRAKSLLKGFQKGSHGLALDLPGLWPVTCEQSITTAAFRPEINGQWVVKKVEFSLTKSSGLRTRLDCETPGAATETTAASTASTPNLGGIVPGASPLGNSDGSDDPEASNDGEEQDNQEATENE